MKKLFKSMLTCALATTMIFSAVACSPEVIEQVDETKSQLYVFNYNGGVGSAWITKAQEDFAKAFENYSFEEGKKGVQFMPENAKTAELQTIANTNNEVIFSEIANYPSLVDSNVLLDITDIMDVPLNEYLVNENGQPVTNDTESIKDKMYKESIDFYSYKADKFYGLPHYSVFSGITYNRALFEQKKLYFAKNPGTTTESKFIQRGNLDKSCGPDGQYGTTDDGLPATWEEMFTLCDYMLTRDVTPFIWCGNTESRAGYYNYLLNAVYLNLAGAEQAKYNYTFDSGENEITIVESIDSKGNVTTKKEVINSSNFDKVLNSELAKYETIKVADRILDNTSWQHKICNNGTASMLATQQAFIRSTNLDDKPAAMLVEGSYWYNEADDADYISDSAKYDPDYYEDNDYQMLTLPRIYGGSFKDIENTTMRKTVVNDQNDTLACINAKIASNPDKVKLAKMFLAYCYTQEKLAEFTEITRVTRSLKYDVNISNLDDWGKTVWEYTKASDLVLPYSDNTLFLSNRTKLSMHINNTFWNNTGAAYNGIKGSEKSATDYFKAYMTREWSKK